VTNLLQETVEILKANGKTPADVLWVGGKESGWKDDAKFVGLWPDFESAANFDYDAGYGGAQINTSLKIVGDNWWLERGEYDGSEWWEFKTLPGKPENANPMRASDLKDR
jgi:hypothetical protein